MAKQIKAEDLKTADAVQDAMNQSLITNDELPIPINQAIEMFEKTPEMELEEITSEYFEFETKGDYYFVFEGMTTMDIKNQTTQLTETKEAVRLVDKSGQRLINANTVLVRELKKLTEIPSFVKVSYVEDVKSASGSYKSFRIFRLKPKS